MLKIRIVLIILNIWVLSMEETKKEPKKWAKLNIEPEYLQPIKQIAVDENLYVYQLIADIFREKYPGYFRTC